MTHEIVLNSDLLKAFALIEKNKSEYQYSHFFRVVHDENRIQSFAQSVPKENRFSKTVFGAFTFHDEKTAEVDGIPRLHQFVVVWDEDFDDRIIRVLERIYLAGFLTFISCIGEREGSLFVLLTKESIDARHPILSEDEFKSDIQEWISTYTPENDKWSVYVNSEDCEYLSDNIYFTGSIGIPTGFHDFDATNGDR